MWARSLIGIIVAIIMIVLGLMFGCKGNENEYKKSEKGFCACIQKEPKSQNDTEKIYFGNLTKQSDKHQY